MKAEELKRNAYKKCKIFVESKWIDIEYHFTEEELEQYTDEVSREKAVDFELRHVYKGASKSAKKLAYMQFDEWKSKQKQ